MNKLSAWKAFAIVVASFLVFSLVASGIATITFMYYPQNYVTLMAIQSMSSIVMFALPALVSMKIIAQSACHTIKGKTTFRIALMAILAILCSQHLIEWSGFINEYLATLPEFSDFTTEEFQLTNARLLSEMICFDDYSDWTLTITVIAILPAICEELFFRATLQTSIEKITHNSTTAIIATSIIFSAMHVEFSAFIPRFILGCILGTIYHISGSIIPGILSHMANNIASILCIYSTVGEGKSIYDSLLLPSEDPGLLKTLISLTLVFFLLTSIYKYKKIRKIPLKK